jgi:DNA-binding NarL/FixJ family response regulator
MSSHMPTRLIVLASATLYRAAWQALLAKQPDILVVGTVDDISQVSAFLEPGQPTTVLFDLPSPLPALAQQLKTVIPDLGLLFLVDSYELEQILPLLQAGATGCISRDEPVAKLARAIIAVGRGATPDEEYWSWSTSAIATTFVRLYASTRTSRLCRTQTYEHQTKVRR